MSAALIDVARCIAEDARDLAEGLRHGEGRADIEARVIGLENSTAALRRSLRADYLRSVLDPLPLGGLR